MSNFRADSGNSRSVHGAIPIKRKENKADLSEECSMAHLLLTFSIRL